MTWMQNQSSGAPRNTLHDEGIPNTLGGVGAPIPVRGAGLSGAAFLAGAVVIIIALAIAILMARLL